MLFCSVPPCPPTPPEEGNQSHQRTADMAAERTGAALEETDEVHSSDLEFQEHGGNIPKRHARVTVKYNRKELQRRLDVEKWIDESLERLYAGQVGYGAEKELLFKSREDTSHLDSEATDGD
ncbi:protein phosphatase 1 regulatory subunit 14D-like [Notothenia coriiceps]|uniref:Protein phosphatase 1 regulatory subunit 14D-like n=1 Tax=Notothenia coriiceps TaxID=8208 RepID=A0A6I9N189_9TELE|nr:PREDICTED: protein phosphatase 1 regulatory subunit 14D-like [Notothenia coriiceps]